MYGFNTIVCGVHCKVIYAIYSDDIEWKLYDMNGKHAAKLEALMDGFDCAVLERQCRDDLERLKKRR